MGGGKEIRREEKKRESESKALSMSVTGTIKQHRQRAQHATRHASPSCSHSLILPLLPKCSLIPSALLITQNMCLSFNTPFETLPFTLPSVTTVSQMAPPSGSAHSVSPSTSRSSTAQSTASPHSNSSGDPGSSSSAAGSASPRMSSPHLAQSFHHYTAFTRSSRLSQARSLFSRLGRPGHRFARCHLFRALRKYFS